MANKKNSFFQRLIESIIGGKDSDAERKRQLKNIAKTLAKTHYKFYKPSSDQVLPMLGKLFFEIYKAISNSQIMFNNQNNPNYYKNLVIDNSLSEMQKKLIDSLSEEAIQESAKTMQAAQLKEKIRTDLASFSSNFDQARIQSIDTIYSKLMAFKSFCTFDYYFLLKKFDSTIKENDFSRPLKLNPIDASYIADDLKDFLSIIWSIPLSDDWSDMMQILKTAKGTEPIKPSQWTKITARLNQIKNSRVLEMIIQLTTKDPYYEVTHEEKREQILEAYVEKIKNQAVAAVRKLENEQKNSKIDGILKQIFNTTSVYALQNYTEEASAPFQKKNLGSFEYAKPLSYMKAFLIEYVKKEVREYADLVLIRGKWSTTPLSSEMSESYNALLEISELIVQFDKKLSEEEGEFGLKLKTLLPRAERDKEAANIIKTILGDCNSIARDYIMRATRNLITFAKNTKALIEDYQKPHGEMIINWKELDRFAESPINELGVGVYKKIYLIVNLMQGLLGSQA